MKKFIIGLLIFLGVVGITIVIIFGPFMKRMFSSSTERFDANLTIFLGGGGNSIVLKSEDNTDILVVDTKMGGGAKKLREHVDAISDRARITVVNTHSHSDHTGGNKFFPEARFLVGIHENIPEMKGLEKIDPIPPNEKRTLTIGDETVHVRSMGSGHTWNDVVVYLENRKMLVTGDLIFNGWHPALFKSGGSSVKGWIQALAQLIEDYEVQILVPGHGPLSDRQALLDQQTYFVSIGNAIGNETQLNALREKYDHYFKLPMTSSFDKTVQFIQEERK